MSLFMSEISNALLLVVALSVDTFAVSLLYGGSKVKIPFTSVMIINSICTLVLAIAFLAGIGIQQYLPKEVTKGICVSILFAVGFSKLFDSSIKAIIKKKQFFCKKFAFSISGLCLVLNIYADPNRADTDASHDISSKEAIALALALSIDGLGVGLGASLLQTNLLILLALSFCIGTAAVQLGAWIGNAIAAKIECNLSWISGIIIMILAFCKR